MPRYAYQFPVDLRTADGKLYRGITRDYSRTGIGIIISAELNMGDVVNLTLHMPDGSKPRKIEATVRRRYGSVYGVEFAELI